jgi:hypothetical protein
MSKHVRTGKFILISVACIVILNIAADYYDVEHNVKIERSSIVIAT